MSYFKAVPRDFPRGTDEKYEKSVRIAGIPDRDSKTRHTVPTVARPSHWYRCCRNYEVGEVSNEILFTSSSTKIGYLASCPKLKQWIANRMTSWNHLIPKLSAVLAYYFRVMNYFYLAWCQWYFIDWSMQSRMLWRHVSPHLPLAHHCRSRVRFARRGGVEHVALGSWLV